MTDLLEFLTSQEIIVVYVTATIACILCLMIYIVEKNSQKAKQRHNTRELNKLVEQIKEEVEEVPRIVYSEPVLRPIQQETLEYTTIEPDPETAKKELQKLTEEMQKQEEKTENITLTSFEEYQEENAIISLDEFLKHSKTLYENNENKQYLEEGNEPITIQELEQRTGLTTTKYEDSFQISQVVSVEEETEEEIKRFKNSPIISPIFGIEKEENIQLENTANYEKLDDEIRKTNEFLMTLKELQKKLDQ